MIQYYFLVFLAVVMFGGCFKMKDVYRAMRGSNLKISTQFTLVSSLFTLPVLVLLLLIKTKGALVFDPFILFMAFLSSLNGILFSFCSFKALGKINLSMFSLFSMLGGMLLPSLQGLLFLDEKLTLAKGVCFAFIVAALLLTVKKGDKKQGGFLYYVGVFVLNGMSGVLATILNCSKSGGITGVSEAYSAWSCVWSILLSLAVLLVLRKKMPSPPVKPLAMLVSAGSGVTNKIANLFLLFSRGPDRLDNTILDPLVTGGVMVVSTVFCFFGDKKPGKREILSIALAVCGMICLFLIPEIQAALGTWFAK